MELEQLDFAKAGFEEIDIALITYDQKQSARDYWLGKCLVQIDARRIWVESAFTSLSNYMEIRLGWDPHTTAERLRTAKALETLPLLAQALREGRLRWSAVRELTRKALPGTEAAWIDWCFQEGVCRRVHEIAMAVQCRRPGALPTDAPDPELFRRVMRFECNSEEYGILSSIIDQVRRALGDEGRELTDAACLSLALQGKVKDLRLDFTQCETCRQGGVRTKGTVAPTEGHFLDAVACCGQVIGADGNLLSRHVPQSILRAVLLRAGYRCEVPICRARWWVQVHHLKLFSEGGTHALVNLMALCPSHHQKHHEGFLVIEGSRQDGFVFKYADGTVLGRQPAYDRAKAFENAFAALRNGGLAEGRTHEVLRQVRERGSAGTEEEILEQAAAILNANHGPEERADHIAEAAPLYRVVPVPRGTERTRAPGRWLQA